MTKALNESDAAQVENFDKPRQPDWNPGELLRDAVKSGATKNELGGSAEESEDEVKGVKGGKGKGEDAEDDGKGAKGQKGEDDDKGAKGQKGEDDDKFGDKGKIKDEDPEDMTRLKKKLESMLPDKKSPVKDQVFDKSALSNYDLPALDVTSA